MKLVLPAPESLEDSRQSWQPRWLALFEGDHPTLHRKQRLEARVEFQTGERIENRQRHRSRRDDGSGTSSTFERLPRARKIQARGLANVKTPSRRRLFLRRQVKTPLARARPRDFLRRNNRLRRHLD